MRKTFAVLALSLSLAGCAARVKTVTDLPAGVTQKQAQDYDAAVRYLHEMASVTSSLRQAVIGVHDAKAFASDDAYVAMLQGLGRIDQIQLAASQMLRQAPQAFGQPQKQQIELYMQLATNEVQKLNSAAALNVKNTQSQQQLNDLISNLANLVKITLALGS